MSTFLDRAIAAAGLVRMAASTLSGRTVATAPSTVAAAARPVATAVAAGPGVASQAPPMRWSGTRGTSSSGRVKELTPARIASYLEQANRGDTRAFAELCQQVQDRDTHLVAALGVRKRAVANLNWSLVPASEDATDRHIAEETTRLLRQTTRLRAGMLGLLDAVMTGYAGLEIEWVHDGGLVRPKRLHHRPAEWLRPDIDDPEAWRVLDPADPVYGVPLRPRGWVLHVSQAKSGWPTQSGLGRVILWWYLFKNYGTKDWVSYNEKFGSPLRIGRYPAGAEATDIDSLTEALAQLGVDAYASIPDDMKVEFVADGGAKTGADTFERLLNFGNREISKVLLGGTLTIEGGANGTQALGTVHNDVRADIRDADALELAETFTRDLVAPMVAFNYGGSAAVPEFKYDIDPAPDKKADAEAQEARGRVFLTARQLGVAVPMSQVREELGIREPAAGEAVLPPLPAPAPAFRARAVPGPHIAAAERPVGLVSAVLQYEQVLGEHRGAVAGAWAAIVAELRAELGDQVSAAALRARLPAILERLDYAPYADALTNAMLSSEALGTLQVRAGDKTAVTLPTSAPMADPAAWAKALGVSEADWTARQVKTRGQAFDAVHYAVLRTAQDLLAALDDEASGEPAAERARSSLEGAQTNAQRTTNVVDGATAGRWADGRWEGITATKGKRLYLRYHIVGEPDGDGANRPTHKAMGGKVYPAEHPIWKVWRPPNGYGCRCWVTVHTYEEVLAAGWTITEDFVELDGEPVVPDPGWQRHHGEADYDWGSFPESWRTALKVREEKV